METPLTPSSHPQNLALSSPSLRRDEFTSYGFPMWALTVSVTRTGLSHCHLVLDASYLLYTCVQSCSVCPVLSAFHIVLGDIMLGDNSRLDYDLPLLAGPTAFSLLSRRGLVQSLPAFNHVPCELPFHLWSHGYMQQPALNLHPYWVLCLECFSLVSSDFTP